MLQFFNSILYLNLRYFKMDNLKNWMKDDQMNEEFYERLTEYLAISGIHGKGTNFNQFTPRMASGKLKHQNKFKFIVSVIFPNLESVKGMYPFVKKCPILLPVGWTFRWVRLIFKHPKSTMNKIGKLNVKNQEIEKVTDLFDKIGLN